MSDFALDLDHDGIRLLRRDRGDWQAIGSVRLDDSNLPARLHAMRSAAERQSDGRLETLLVIPSSQILYTTVPAPMGRTRIRDEDVAAALDGLTPCPIDEMVFDWRRGDGVIQVAALDINTLDEAESFAATYGFNPVAFTAFPKPSEFPEPPDFGPTERARPRDPEESAAAAPGRPAAVEPPLRTPRRPPPDRPAEDGIDRTVVIGAIAALAVMAAMVWTALALIRPDSLPPRPELAQTPSTESTAPAVQTPAGTMRIARDWPRNLPLPALPRDDADLPTTTDMAGRGETAIFGPGATTVEHELPTQADEGVLLAADIWQTPPSLPADHAGETLDALYVPSIDPAVRVDDAIALAEPPAAEDTPAAPGLPPDPGTVFELDDRGLVIATPEGALTPDGIIVTLGRPAATPPTRPATAVVAPDPAIALVLAGKQPRARPGDLIERVERGQLGGRTLAELAGLRPRARPASAQALAEAADPAPEISDSPLAVEVSRAPSHRPIDFAAIVAAAQARRLANETGRVTQVAAGAVATPQPSIPSSASVARQATIENAINLRKLNLIGVYGSASDRRALVRLPSGRFVKVQVGDRIDGGRVQAIGDDALSYVKGGRTLTLQVPSG